MLLYDADKIDEAAAVEDPKSLYEAQLGVFLDPNAPEVIAEAQKQGIPQSWIDAAQRPGLQDGDGVESGFPAAPGIPDPADGVVHPAAVADPVRDGKRPDRRERHHSGCQGFAHPIQYLANLLTAGKEEPVVKALETMVAMRRYMRKKSVEKVSDAATLKGTHLNPAQVEEMYQVMAIANYEDRFVIPSSHKELVENTFEDKASCGFTFGNGCSGGESEASLFGKKRRPHRVPRHAARPQVNSGQ